MFKLFALTYLCEYFGYISIIPFYFHPQLHPSAFNFDKYVLESMLNKASFGVYKIKSEELTEKKYAAVICCINRVHFYQNIIMEKCPRTN